MVNLPAARRHHRSRTGYALGLFVFLGFATALALVVRHPAFSATEQLAVPVPAPEITVAGADARPTAGPAGDEPAANEPAEDEPAEVEQPSAADGTDVSPPSGAGGGAGEDTLADRPTGSADLSRPLLYSGLLGLAISLAGLGLVGTRRRQW
ncbi:hypothetical protein ACH495_01135 [Micromonospora sp. NPDC018662]|uniref:hypothetical protein n=1 Tax=Micromonospora sp. NPDC018662 TaxID=3364238 RepID=UPI0037A4FD71